MTPGETVKQLPWQPTDFQRIIEHSPALIHTAQPDGALDFFNQRWLDFVGASLPDLLGWSWVSFVHPDDATKFVETWRSSIRTGEFCEMEARVRRADGQFRWMIHQTMPLRDSQGTVLKWFGSSIEIEDRKQSEARLQQCLIELQELKDELYKENIALRDEVDKKSMFEEILGVSPALNAVLARMAKVAPTDSTVLITGETGTGKELVARAIHKRSRRTAKAFVAVNCAAVPHDLIASELFGHEKGAFTGATQRRLGRFELAQGGTIFLDEVGELPHETQVALLRVLQEREFERVGGSTLIRANVRVIAATNRDLEAAVAAGTFRSDLFYRLNVFPIETPPLRKRKEDIPLLVEYFVDRYARDTGKTIRRMSRQSLEMLQEYPWPGNVRELQNIIERSVILCQSEEFSIDPSWLSRRWNPTDLNPPAELFQQLAVRERDDRGRPQTVFRSRLRPLRSRLETRHSPLYARV